MATSTQPQFRINGVVDTSRTVWENVEDIAASASAFVTFNTQSGRYEIVINGPAESVFEFTDDNIVGPISLSETGFQDLYNVVEISFPHKDLNDQRDTIRFEIAPENRNPFEPQNTLSIQTDLINDPVQAEQIALTELKQSRVSKLIEFETDFSTYGLSAGDVVSVTNEIFAWEQKLFRIISIQETDADDGGIQLRYSCLEYDEAVYDYSDISRFIRSRENGFTSFYQSTGVADVKAVNTAENLDAALQTDEGKTIITETGIPILQTAATGWTPEDIEDVFNGGPGANFGTEFNITGNPSKLMQLSFEGPTGVFTYNTTINGSTVSRSINAGIPCKITFEYSSNGGATYTPLQSRFLDWATYTTVLNISNTPIGRYRLTIEKVITFDLDQEGSNVVTPTGYTISSLNVDADGDGNDEGAILSIVLFE
jgi:hypothetical protein